MWVLIVTFLAMGDPPSLHFASQVTMHDFNSEQSCKEARDAYMAGLEKTIENLNAALADEIKVGELKGPNEVLLKSICVKK